MSAFLLRYGVTEPRAIQSLAAWMQALSIGQWTQLSNVNTLSSVYASNTGQYGDAGPVSLMDAWSGNVYIPSFGNYGSIIIAATGGHKNYYGNETYVADLETLTWRRDTSPSVESNWDATFTNGLTGDGKPTAVHTYYYLFCRNGKFGTAKRQVTNSPTAVYMVSLYDPVTKTWQNSLQEAATLQNTNDEGACYDPDRDVLWLVEANPLQWAKYSFTLDSWTTHTAPTGGLQPQCGPVYCEVRQAVVQFVDDAVWGLDPADPDHEKYVISTTGTGPTRGVGDMPRWCNNQDSIIYYPSKSNSLYKLAPPAGNWRSGNWAWSQISTTGTTGTHTGQGTYGKFHIIERGTWSCALVCGGPAEPFQACRLT